eukprot:403349045
MDYQQHLNQQNPYSQQDLQQYTNSKMDQKPRKMTNYEGGSPQQNNIRQVSNTNHKQKHQQPGIDDLNIQNQQNSLEMKFPNINKSAQNKTQKQTYKSLPRHQQDFTHAQSKEAAEKEFLIHTILKKQLNQMRNLNYKFEKNENDKIAKYFKLDVSGNGLDQQQQEFSNSGHKSTIEPLSHSKIDSSIPGLMSQDEDFNNELSNSKSKNLYNSLNQKQQNNTNLHSLQQPVYLRNQNHTHDNQQNQQQQMGRSIQHNVPENVQIKGYVGSEDRYRTHRKKKIKLKRDFLENAAGKLQFDQSYIQKQQFPEIQIHNQDQYQNQHQQILTIENRSKTTIKLNSQKPLMKIKPINNINLQQFHDKIAYNSQESDAANNSPKGNNRREHIDTQQTLETASFDYSQHMAQRQNQSKIRSNDRQKEYRLIMNQTQINQAPKFYTKKYVSPRRIHHHCQYCQHKHSPQYLGNLALYQGKNLLPQDIANFREKMKNQDYLKKGQNNLAHKQSQQQYHQIHQHNHQPNYESDNHMFNSDNKRRREVPSQNNQSLRRNQHDNQDFEKYYYSDQNHQKLMEKNHNHLYHNHPQGTQQNVQQLKNVRLAQLPPVQNNQSFNRNSNMQQVSQNGVNQVTFDHTFNPNVFLQDQKQSLHNTQSPIKGQILMNNTQKQFVNQATQSPSNKHINHNSTVHSSQIINKSHKNQQNILTPSEAQTKMEMMQNYQSQEMTINNNNFSPNGRSIQLNSSDINLQQKNLTQTNSTTGMKFPLLVQNQGGSLAGDYIGEMYNEGLRTENNTKMGRQGANQIQMQQILANNSSNYKGSYMMQSFGQSPGARSPPAWIEDQLYDRLMGRSKLSSHVCSTNHHGKRQHPHTHKNIHSNQSPKFEFQGPLIKPRRDESTSPMEFSENEENRARSVEIDADQFQVMRKSANIETDRIKEPDRVSIEIQTQEVVLKNNEPNPEEYIPKRNQDWSRAQIYKYVYKKYQAEQKFKQAQENVANPNDVVDQNQTPVQIEDNFNPENKQMYTEIEATYKASLLKKKARTYNQPEMLQEFHDRAKTTIEILTNNMIPADVSLERIFEHYEEVNRPNVIKLLLRCKMLYVARVDVKAILMAIIKKEKAFKQIEVLMNEAFTNGKLNPQLQHLLFDGLRIQQRLLSQISQFKHEHKVFKGNFIFKKQDYSEALTEEMKLMEDFIEIQGLKKPQELEEEIDRLRQSREMMYDNQMSQSRQALKDHLQHQNELLKKLLPHEYHQYLIRNGVRADSRTLTQHRPITVKRQVLQSYTNNNQQQQMNFRASGAVNQGKTLIIGQASLKNQDHATISERPLTLSIQLMRELQQQHVRRDYQGQKEFFYAHHIKKQVELCIDFSLIVNHEVRGEIIMTFNVLADDGNLVSAITCLAMDLILQLQHISNIKFVKQLCWESMIVISEGSLIADPSIEESYVSNNHLAVTIYEDGKQLIEKSESLRTYTSQMQQPLEFGSSTMSLDEISRGITYIQKLSKLVFIGLRTNEIDSEIKEFTISFD